MANRILSTPPNLGNINKGESSPPPGPSGPPTPSCSTPEQSIASRNKETQKQDELRAPLIERDSPFCNWPGCEKGTNLTSHHISPASLGKPTILANLVLLCHSHHIQIHKFLRIPQSGKTHKLKPKFAQVWGTPYSASERPKATKPAALLAASKALESEVLL